ncbi:MAG TPA: hypothetical protein VF062_08145 [Candidatus Limnocylindrales bacterium]
MQTKRSELRSILVAGAVTAVVCGGIPVAGVFLTIQAGFWAARNAAAHHADALVAGDYARAYGQLCSSYRSSVSKDDYVRLSAENYRQLRGYEVVDADVPLRGKSTVTIKLIDQAGAQTTHVWPVKPDEGEFKVCFSTD